MILCVKGLLLLVSWLTDYLFFGSPSAPFYWTFLFPLPFYSTEVWSPLLQGHSLSSFHLHLDVTGSLDKVSYKVSSAPHGLPVSSLSLETGPPSLPMRAV